MPYPYSLTPDDHTLEPEDVVKPPAETQEDSTSTHSPHLDFGNPLPPAQQTPAREQSTGQASSSKSGKQSGTGSDKSDKTSMPQQQSLNQPSTSGFPPDIASKPDISEKEVFEVCGQCCQQNPQAMAAVMNLIEGFSPDDDEQTLEQRVSNHLRIMGLNDAFGHGDWYTTRLDPPMEHTAMRNVNYYFDRVEASEAALAAMSATQAELPPAQGQAHAGVGGFEQSEISLLLQWGLTETFPGESDTGRTTKEEVQDVLVSDLKRIIPGYDETARVVPGFDDMVINWADLTLDESLALYRVEIALELEARAEHYEGFLPPEYDEIKAVLDRATLLESLAGPIPLDDTEAYAAAFAGRAYVPDAEHERRHVERQLMLVYDQILGEESDHLATLSTTELKYELYYRLNYDVLPFVKSDEHAIQLQISYFMKDYTAVAGDTPEGVIARLQGTFQQPDVLGFLFIMGLSIAYEPVDYALTAVDVIQALSEGDTESAIGNFLLGAAPGLNSKMDDVLQPFFGRLDNIRLLPARADLPPRHTLKARGFTDAMIDAFEFRGATGPGTGLAEHRRILGDGTEHTSAVTTRNDDLGHRAQDANAQILREQYGYNVISEPSDDMFRRAGIDPSGRTPDYFIEGKPFDAYTVSPPRDLNAPEATLINTVLNAIYEKVPGQTNRLVIDLSHTPMTSERFIEDLSRYYVKGEPLTDLTLKELKEIKFLRDGRLTDIWVNPML